MELTKRDIKRYEKATGKKMSFADYMLIRQNFTRKDFNEFIRRSGKIKR